MSSVGSKRKMMGAPRYGAPKASSKKPRSKPKPSSLTAQLNRRGLANRETGFVDFGPQTFNHDISAGTISLIATIPQGASVQSRVGKKVLLKSLQAHGICSNGTTATYNDVTLLIVYDRRPTGSLPAITDILTQVSSFAFNNDANSGRFRILKRIDMSMIGNYSSVTGFVTESSVKSMDFYLDLRGLPTVFKAAGTGAIGDIEEGALYCVSVGSQLAGTTAASSQMTFRTRFLDV